MSILKQTIEDCIFIDKILFKKRKKNGIIYYRMDYTKLMEAFEKMGG